MKPFHLDLSFQYNLVRTIGFTTFYVRFQDLKIINFKCDSKTLSKDKVTLNLKKNYRTVDGKFEATVVVQTENASGTIGFKVTAVESTAKNLNLDDYSPYTYEVVDYEASEVTLQLK